MRAKHDEARTPLALLTGDELAIVLIEKAMSTLLIEDQLELPPLFRLEANEKLSTLTLYVLQTFPEHPHPIESHQQRLREYVKHVLHRVIAKIARRALHAQDKRTREIQEASALCASLARVHTYNAPRSPRAPAPRQVSAP